jgi:hypothetical protein
VEQIGHFISISGRSGINALDLVIYSHWRKQGIHKFLKLCGISICLQAIFVFTLSKESAFKNPVRNLSP